MTNRHDPQHTAAEHRPPWWRRVPLRVRLIAAFAAAMLVVLTGAGGFVYLRVQYALDRRLDADLTAQSTAVTTALNDGTLGPRNPAVVSGGLYQILDPTGAILNASTGLTARPLLNAAQLATALRQPVRTDRGTLLPISTEPLRVLAAPLAATGVAGPGRPAVAAVAVRRDQRDEALRELVAQLALANLAALAIASFVGYRLARAALDPVERYRAQAARIAAGATGVRLDVPATDDEIARLGRTLNTMLTALDTALERERRFVNDASHELRTPLTLLAAELELALRRPRPAAELEQALRSAATDTAGLIALADTLLAVGVQPAPATAPLDLVATLPPIIDRYRRAAGLTSTQLRVELNPAPPVRLDPPSLERIVTNLLDNALRHGAPPVTVTTGPADEHVALAVHDDGPGMRADFLPHAAERFTRADTARSTPGTGLGLSLVRSIAEAHGGQVRVCSAAAHHHPDSTPAPCVHPGTGTTVAVVLPAMPAREPPTPAGTSTAITSTTTRPRDRLVMAVSDDETALRQTPRDTGKRLPAS